MELPCVRIVRLTLESVKYKKNLLFLRTLPQELSGNGSNSGGGARCKDSARKRQSARSSALGVCGGWDIWPCRKPLSAGPRAVRSLPGRGHRLGAWQGDCGFALVIGFSAIATGLAAWFVRKFAPGAKGSGIPD